MEFILALLQVISLMAMVTTIQGVHVDPNDIRRTIQSECGDIIDCVDMHKHFPSLKEQLQEDREIHKMQQKREHPKLLDRLAERNYKIPEQTWRRNGSCPDGTVPIRRMPANVNREAASSRTNHSFRLFGRPTGETVQDNANGKEEIAAAYSVAGPYHGAYAAIPIWRTRVEPNEFSKSYLLIAGSVDRTHTPIKGKDPPDTTYQIAVGMAVWPSVLGDDQSRFFVYYTNPGEPVWRISVNGDELGHIQEGTFPMGFFESLHNEMGGRVLNTRPGGRHTMTQMGSGMYASSGSNNAATIAFYMAVNNDGGDQLDYPVNLIVTSPKCYDVNNYGNDKVRAGYDVGFGGPGGYYCDQS